MTTFLNLMVVLVPFLLITAVFSLDTIGIKTDTTPQEILIKCVRHFILEITDKLFPKELLRHLPIPSRYDSVFRVLVF